MHYCSVLQCTMEAQGGGRAGFKWRPRDQSRMGASQSLAPPAMKGYLKSRPESRGRPVAQAPDGVQSKETVA